MSKMHFGQYLGNITETQCALGIKKGLMIVHKPFNIKLLLMVGDTGIEPVTSCMSSRTASKSQMFKN